MVLFTNNQKFEIIQKTEERIEPDLSLSYPIESCSEVWAGEASILSWMWLIVFIPL